MKVRYSKKFTTHVQRTDRVLEVSEAFGLGLDDREFVIYDGLELDIEPGDVVYITGQSGSGKSLLLREIAIQAAAQGHKVADIDKIVMPSLPLCDQVGKTTNEGLEMLSKVGLNDAYLFVRKPEELSDGQRYRLRLAHLLNSEADVWVADEFGAVLDRVTARIVSYSISKHARANGKILVVATTHTDLEAELAPTIRIEKRFREKIEVQRQPNAP